MGDGADMALDAVMTQDELMLEYMSGHMDTQDAIDAGLLDEFGNIPNIHTAKTKICRCCGEGGLRWGKSNSKWRLFKDGKLHDCKANPLKENE